MTQGYIAWKHMLFVVLSVVVVVASMKVVDSEAFPHMATMASVHDARAVLHAMSSFDARPWNLPGSGKFTSCSKHPFPPLMSKPRSFGRLSAHSPVRLDGQAAFRIYRHSRRETFVLLVHPVSCSSHCRNVAHLYGTGSSRREHRQIRLQLPFGSMEDPAVAAPRVSCVNLGE
jgi:hypothetical protein